uniref:Large ribosomal subunit protein uL4c n=1 Tax=Pterocladiophila hemisphaerica TaxID=2712948 RepID=A0A6M3WX42_9FLOR|nr:ribosomal protein L4 [Pterocladiophila hemisphaerica]
MTKFLPNIDKKRKMSILHKAVTVELNQNHQCTAKTKTRKDVKGGGAKPRPQKGSGKARIGSLSSPLCRGGGVIFGPQNKKKELKINKKERKLAFKILLMNKKKDIYYLQNNFCNFQEPKTQNFIQQIKELKLKFILNTNKNILILLDHQNIILLKSIANISNIIVLSVKEINLQIILKADTILISFSAFKYLKKRYNV